MNRVIIEQDFIPRGSPARSGLKLSNPTSITIHWIGPFPGQTPEMVRNYWMTALASAHYIVKDNRIVQCIPASEVAWHAGPKANYTSLGIEVIPANKEGKFSDLSIETLIYCISTLPRLPLMRHYDWTQKDCPLYYTPFAADGNKHWEELKARIEEEIWNED